MALPQPLCEAIRASLPAADDMSAAAAVSMRPADHGMQLRARPHHTSSRCLQTICASVSPNVFTLRWALLGGSPTQHNDRLLHYGPVRSSLHAQQPATAYSALIALAGATLPSRDCASLPCLGCPPPMRGNSSELRSRSEALAVPSALTYWACGPCALVDKPLPSADVTAAGDASHTGRSDAERRRELHWA